MYKAFIADDEEFVVKSLIRAGKWEDYGFEVVLSVNDGLDAYETILKIKPDIVFTDIRMPGMNGLEIIKNVRDVHKDILFVVISGYAEFAYAQKALVYGAIGFCLKPFDDDEINNVLKKAKDILDRSNNVDECEFISLLEESTEESELKLYSYLNKKGIRVEKGITVTASIGIKEIKFNEDIRYIAVKTGNLKYIYIVENTTNMDYRQILCEKQSEDIKGIGICSRIYSTKNLRKHVHEANTLAYQFFITGRRDIYTKGAHSYKDIEILIDKFEEATIKMDIDEVKEILISLGSCAENEALNIKHAVNIYNVYVRYSWRVLGEASSEECVYNIEELCIRFKDVCTMLQYIAKTVSGLKGLRTDILKTGVKNEQFRKIIDYINHNFHKEISIQSLSQEFIINQSYISQLFRKELGMTFTDYLTKLRINHSKELLQSRKYSLSEVANKCGYTDYFYFIRVFKKVTGLAPGQFRDGRK